MRPLCYRKNRSKAQTTIEYILVIGVLAAGIILVGRKVFHDPEDGLAQKLMQQAVQQASNTMGDGT